MVWPEAPSQVPRTLFHADARKRTCRANDKCAIVLASPTANSPTASVYAVGGIYFLDPCHLGISNPANEAALPACMRAPATGPSPRGPTGRTSCRRSLRGTASPHPRATPAATIALDGGVPRVLQKDASRATQEERALSQICPKQMVKARAWTRAHLSGPSGRARLSDLRSQLWRQNQSQKGGISYNSNSLS